MLKHFTIVSLIFSYVISAPWRGQEFVYYINPENRHGFTAEQIENAASFAVNQWLETGASLSVRYAGRTNAKGNVGDKKNVIYFDNTRKTNLLGDTFSWYEYRDGKRYRKTETDILIYQLDKNGNLKPTMVGDSPCNKQWHLEDTLVHEFGHAFGLSHTTISRTTMYPSVGGKCSTKWRSLDTDDINGILALYPKE